MGARLLQAASGRWLLDMLASHKMRSMGQAAAAAGAAEAALHSRKSQDEMLGH